MIWRSNERVILTFDEVAVESVFSGVIECDDSRARRIFDVFECYEGMVPCRWQMLTKC